VSFPIVVLVSGEGTNLQALIDRVHGGDVEIVGVAASKAGARGLERAQAAGIETAVFAIADHADRGARDAALADWIEARGARLVVLAGFMELLGAAFIGRFRNAIVNVHPALLPAFPGVHAIEQSLDYGVKVSGVTVHFVDEGVDSGPIIVQRPFDLPYPRDIAAIETIVHEIEHELLPHAVRLIAQGKVRIDSAQPRWVIVDE
jgi:phosphoribosylglycinamide formyltransferase 1